MQSTLLKRCYGVRILCLMVRCIDYSCGRALRTSRHDGRGNSRTSSRLDKILSPDIKLFLNIHPDELCSGDALLVRLRKLEEWSERIVLEITERSKLQQIESWEETLAQIETMGFEVAIDDLGAGYASLSVLPIYDQNILKWTCLSFEMFIKTIAKDVLVTLMCDFANATNAMIVAEGIEVEDELVALQECGVHLLQGFFFARPSLDTDRISSIMNKAVGLMSV